MIKQILYDISVSHAVLNILGLLFKVQLKVPVVVRLEGTNVDQGKRILKVNSEPDNVGHFRL